MKALFSGIAAAAVLMASGCQAKEPPTQVVYRFDDHRYLELKGWDCEGELWYTDTQKEFILSHIPFYRILPKNLYILQNDILPFTSWGGGDLVSKDLENMAVSAVFSRRK
jgi:hypothetical protein